MIRGRGLATVCGAFSSENFFGKSLIKNTFSHIFFFLPYAETFIKADHHSCSYEPEPRQSKF